MIGFSNSNIIKYLGKLNRETEITINKDIFWEPFPINPLVSQEINLLKQKTPFYYKENGEWKIYEGSTDFLIDVCSFFGPNDMHFITSKENFFEASAPEDVSISHDSYYNAINEDENKCPYMVPHKVTDVTFSPVSMDRYRTILFHLRWTYTYGYTTFFTWGNLKLYVYHRKFYLICSECGYEKEISSTFLPRPSEFMIFTFDANGVFSVYRNTEKIFEDNLGDMLDQIKGDEVFKTFGGYYDFYSLHILEKRVTERDLKMLRFFPCLSCLNGNNKTLYQISTPKLFYAFTNDFSVNVKTKKLNVVKFGSNFIEVAEDKEYPIKLFKNYLEHNGKKYVYKNTETHNDYYLIYNGQSITYSTDAIDYRASLLGYELFCPHSKEEYYEAMKWLKDNGYPYSYVGPLGIYYPEKGPGCCSWEMKNHALNSDDLGKLGWRVVDGSETWWASDLTSVNQPDGNYTANAFLGEFSFDDEGNLTHWNDNWANYSYSTYLCVKRFFKRLEFDSSIILYEPHEVEFNVFKEVKLDAELNEYYVYGEEYSIIEFNKSFSMLKTDHKVESPFIFIDHNIYKVLSVEDNSDGTFNVNISFVFSIVKPEFKSSFKEIPIIGKENIKDNIFKTTYSGKIKGKGNLFLKLESDCKVIYNNTDFGDIL